MGKRVASEYDKGGIFSFTEHEKEIIDQSKKAGRNTTMLKRIDMIAYLIEIAYDLAISPLDNVSESPWFESCLCVDRSEGV